MSQSPGLRLERLGPDHDLTDFNCGKADLNRWLQQHELSAQEMDSARSFVLTRSGKVLGYFSLTMGSVRRSEVSAKRGRGLDTGRVGLVLLSRLAVDKSEHGSGLGKRLLAEALRKAVIAGAATSAELVVIDAIDDAAAEFYRRFGLVSVPGHPLRLYRRMKDIAASSNSSE